MDVDRSIWARGLAREFADVKAVDGIDLDIGSGRIFGFLGPNGPMVAGAVLLVGQVILILLLGLALGLKSATGVGGMLVVLVYAFLWGMAFAGYAVAVSLKSKNSAAAHAATFAFFPLIFLSTTFVPKAYITATWLKWAATINPTTYIYDSMRSLLIDGWQARPLLIGLGVVLGFATLTGALALRQARRATQLG